MNATKRIIATLVTLGLVSSTAVAAPSVKFSYNTFTVTEGVNDAVLAQIKADIGKADKAKLSFKLEKITNEDLARFCAAFPDAPELEVSDSKDLDSFAPVASLKNLRGFGMSRTKVADLSPLAGLTQLERLDLTGDAFGPDLKWMSRLAKLEYISLYGGDKLVSFAGIPALPALKRAAFMNAAPADLTPLVTALTGLTELKLNNCTLKDLTPLASLAKLDELNLYGAKVKDFSPLAGCAKLRTLNYYATKDSDYSTLGKLTQVEDLQGGLTDLADIAWVAALPNLKKLRVFAENVTDYTPLAKAKVEHLTIWNMKKNVDLTQLSGATSLTYLKVWSMDKGVSGFDGIGALVNLKELIINTVNKKEGDVDVAFLKTLVNLEKLELYESKILNFDTVASCAKLTDVNLVKSTGITSLAALKKLPALKSLTITKNVFPADELEGFDPKVKITQR